MKVFQNEPFKTMRRHGLFLTLILSAVLITASCGGNGGSDSSDNGENDEPNTPEYQFNFSCTPVGGDACENHYDNGPGCAATDTYSTNPCPADGALGVCTVTSPNGGYIEWVPYHFPPGNPPAETQCTVWLEGVWSNTYLGQ